MRALFLRLSIAVLLSLSTLAITLWWYDVTLPRTANNTTGKPIAFVGPIVNEVLKRPADRLLWQNAETNEPLFNGEAIRTPADANAKILFEGSGRVLDIEPGSLIVIQKNEGQIALELMEGAIQIAKNQIADSASSNSTELVLKSENGQIDLSQASATLSKNSKTGLSLEVLEGTASVKTKDGKKQLIKTGETGQINQSGYDIKQNQIKLNKPGKTIEISEALEPVKFSWSGTPEKANIGLWIGTKRSTMTEVLQTQENFAMQELDLNTKYFWKVVLYDEQMKVVGESNTGSFETRAKISKTQIAAAPPSVSKSNPLPEKEKVVDLPQEIQTAPPPRPLLLSPNILAEQDPLKANSDGSLQVSWQKIPEAKEYELHLLNREGKLKNKKRYTLQQAFLKNLMPGEYRVRVLAIDQDGKVSEPLPPKSILVPEKSGLRAPAAIKTKIQGQRGTQ